MTFWAYMLHCHGGYFYVGHTDDIDLRMTQHQTGFFPGFTRDHLPVKLVWSANFPTRYEAITAEKQIKGWGRAKKMALIRGDWEAISANAKARTEYLKIPKPVQAEPVEALPCSGHCGVQEGQPFDKLRANGVVGDLAARLLTTIMTDKRA